MKQFTITIFFIIQVIISYSQTKNFAVDSIVFIDSSRNINQSDSKVLRYEYDRDLKKVKRKQEFRVIHLSKLRLLLNSTEFAYNSDTLLERVTLFNNISAFRKTEYTYPSANKIVKNVYSFDSQTNTWNKFNKHVNYYDGFGKNTVDSSFSWDTNTSNWIHSHTDIYKYDQNGFLIEKIESNYINGVKNFGYNRFYSRTSWGAIDSSWSSVFNGTETQYHLMQTLSYNSKKFIEEESGFKWINNNWVSSGKMTYNHDQENNLLEGIFYAYDTTSQTYYLASKLIVKRQNEINVDNLTYVDEDLKFKDFYPKCLEEIKIYILDNNNTLSLGYVELYYYSDLFPIGNNENISNRFSPVAYPNPTDKLLNFFGLGNKNCHFKVWDIYGNVVVNQPISESEPIHLDNLRSGTYFYIIDNGIDVSSNKFILK